MIKKLFRVKAVTALVLIVVYLLGVGIAAASTIYVPDDHSTIQEAVEHANKGDTIFVGDGVYQESVNVNKRLNIRSQNGSSNCTVDGVGTGFILFADETTIKGFTITDSGKGLLVKSDNNIITDNHISNNACGIYLDWRYRCPIECAENSTITNNTITGNECIIQGGAFYGGVNNKVFGNTIYNNTGCTPIPIPTAQACPDVSCYTYMLEGSNKVPLNATVNLYTVFRKMVTGDWIDNQKMTGNDGWANFTDIDTGKCEVVAEYNSSTVSKNITVRGDSETVLEFDFTTPEIQNKPKYDTPAETSETPGFKALFAIAGLLASAYLVRRLLDE